MPIIDVWMQHPTRRFLAQPFFESLRRWNHQQEIPDVPLSLTIDAMAAADVATGLVAAWWGPQGSLIDNDEVASFVCNVLSTICPVSDARMAISAVSASRISPIITASGS